MNTVGKRTPIFLRFSTVAGERGANDCDRDPRGFAIKHYTEEGNYDMVGNNTPVFFIKDPIKFPDFIHSQKRHPAKGVQDPNMAFDFWSYSPEALHQITILMSDRGTPDGYRHMNGYGSHTFKWVNAKGEEFLVKYHYKTDQGIKCFTAEEAAEKGKQDKDWSTNDLFNEIEKGNFPSWTWYAQVMPIADAASYRFDVYDITKVWPHSDYPLQKIGKLVLNKNPENYHAETEQSAFAPAHMVPGIEPSNDKMLQGRLVNYPDTHRHRLGPNYDQIPINCPYRARMGNYNTRDGFMTVNGGNGSLPNYEPNSVSGTPVENRVYSWATEEMQGKAGRYPHMHPNDNYEQPRTLFRKVFDDAMRQKTMDHIAGGLGQCRRDIQERMIKHFYKVDAEYGAGIAKRIGLPVEQPRL
jgi:catalase